LTELRQAAEQLDAEDYKQREIAGVLGIGLGHVNRLLNNVPNGTSETDSGEEKRGANVPNGTSIEGIDTFTTLAATNEIRQQIETKTARAKREETREQERQTNAAKVAHVTDPRELLKYGRFATIVIDPPWDFGDEDEGEGGGPFGRTKHDYASLPLDDILTLPVDLLSDTDCHLYLCITNRSLPKGFRLLEAWGFRYITCLTWVKPSFGIGNYFRGQTEQILFGVKGSQPLKRKDVGTVFEAPRGERHSEKPEALFALVESCSPGPFLEMFQRTPRQGWKGWGENA
jgi:N6-adenosine-specific RNA methylase IME4